MILRVRDDSRDVIIKQINGVSSFVICRDALICDFPSGPDDSVYFKLSDVPVCRSLEIVDLDCSSCEGEAT